MAPSASGGLETPQRNVPATNRACAGRVPTRSAFVAPSGFTHGHAEDPKKAGFAAG